MSLEACLQALPIRIEATFLLFALNEHLSRTALIVQPLSLPSGTDIGKIMPHTLLVILGLKRFALVKESMQGN